MAENLKSVSDDSRGAVSNASVYRYFRNLDKIAEKYTNGSYISDIVDFETMEVVEQNGALTEDMKVASFGHSKLAIPRTISAKDIDKQDYEAFLKDPFGLINTPHCPESPFEEKEDVSDAFNKTYIVKVMEELNEDHLKVLEEDALCKLEESVIIILSSSSSDDSSDEMSGEEDELTSSSSSSDESTYWDSPMYSLKSAPYQQSTQKSEGLQAIHHSSRGFKSPGSLTKEQANLPQSQDQHQMKTGLRKLSGVNQLRHCANVSHSSDRVPRKFLFGSHRAEEENLLLKDESSEDDYVLNTPRTTKKIAVNMGLEVRTSTHAQPNAVGRSVEHSKAQYNRFEENGKQQDSTNSDQQVKRRIALSYIGPVVSKEGQGRTPTEAAPQDGSVLSLSRLSLQEHSPSTQINQEHCTSNPLPLAQISSEKKNFNREHNLANSDTRVSLSASINDKVSQSPAALTSPFTAEEFLDSRKDTNIKVSQPRKGVFFHLMEEIIKRVVKDTAPNLQASSRKGSVEIKRQIETESVPDQDETLSKLEEIFLDENPGTFDATKGASSPRQNVLRNNARQKTYISPVDFFKALKIKKEHGITPDSYQSKAERKNMLMPKVLDLEEANCDNVTAPLPDTPSLISPPTDDADILALRLNEHTGVSKRIMTEAATSTPTKRNASARINFDVSCIPSARSGPPKESPIVHNLCLNQQTSPGRRSELLSTESSCDSDDLLVVDVKNTSVLQLISDVLPEKTVMLEKKCVNNNLLAKIQQVVSEPEDNVHEQSKSLKKLEEIFFDKCNTNDMANIERTTHNTGHNSVHSKTLDRPYASPVDFFKAMKAKQKKENDAYPIENNTGRKQRLAPKSLQLSIPNEIIVSKPVTVQSQPPDICQQSTSVQSRSPVVHQTPSAIDLQSALHTQRSPVHSLSLAVRQQLISVKSLSLTVERSSKSPKQRSSDGRLSSSPAKESLQAPENSCKNKQCTLKRAFTDSDSDSDWSSDNVSFTSLNDTVDSNSMYLQEWSPPAKQRSPCRQVGLSVPKQWSLSTQIDVPPAEKRSRAGKQWSTFKQVLSAPASQRSPSKHSKENSPASKQCSLSTQSRTTSPTSKRWSPFTQSRSKSPVSNQQSPYIQSRPRSPAPKQSPRTRSPASKQWPPSAQSRSPTSKQQSLFTQSRSRSPDSKQWSLFAQSRSRSPASNQQSPYIQPKSRSPASKQSPFTQSRTPPSKRWSPSTQSRLPASKQQSLFTQPWSRSPDSKPWSPSKQSWSPTSKQQSLLTQSRSRSPASKQQSQFAQSRSILESLPSKQRSPSAQSRSRSLTSKQQSLSTQPRSSSPASKQWLPSTQACALSTKQQSPCTQSRSRSPATKQWSLSTQGWSPSVQSNTTTMEHSQARQAAAKQQSPFMQSKLRSLAARQRSAVEQMESKSSLQQLTDKKDFIEPDSDSSSDDGHATSQCAVAENNSRRFFPLGHRLTHSISKGRPLFTPGKKQKSRKERQPHSEHSKPTVSSTKTNKPALVKPSRWSNWSFSQKRQNPQAKSRDVFEICDSHSSSSDSGNEFAALRQKTTSPTTRTQLSDAMVTPGKMRYSRRPERINSPRDNVSSIAENLRQVAGNHSDSFGDTSFDEDTLPLLDNSEISYICPGRDKCTKPFCFMCL